MNTARAAILEILVRDFRLQGRSLGAVLLLAVLLLGAEIGGAQSQNVNDEPITQLEIDQRSKFLEAASPNHKAPSRQEVLDELINEKTIIREGKRRGIDPSDSDVDFIIASMARQVHQSTDQFIQTMSRGGVTPMTVRARVRADLVRRALGE